MQRRLLELTPFEARRRWRCTSGLALAIVAATRWRVRRGLADQNSSLSTPSSQASSRICNFLPVEDGAEKNVWQHREGQRTVDQFQGVVFSLEHAPPARTLHRIHHTGHLHGSRPPIRLACVDRPAISTMVASRLFRVQLRQQQRARSHGRGTVTRRTSIPTDCPMLVCMYVRYVSRERGSRVRHGQSAPPCLWPGRLCVCTGSQVCIYEIVRAHVVSQWRKS